jgi:hypothetical protein
LSRPGQAQDVKKHRSSSAALIPVARIERTTLRLRGHNVMFDADLASLYGVTTRELIQAVKRNIERFPKDFMFQLTGEEFKIFRSQSVISRSGHGGRRTAPYVFTEQGVAMLSSVIQSSRAMQVNIEIMRTFVRLPARKVGVVNVRREIFCSYFRPIEISSFCVRKSSRPSEIAGVASTLDPISFVDSNSYVGLAFSTNT